VLNNDANIAETTVCVLRMRSFCNDKNAQFVRINSFGTNSVFTEGKETEAPMRYRPVKNVKRHEKLHKKVKKLFSAFTLLLFMLFLPPWLSNKRYLPTTLSMMLWICSFHGL